MAKGKDVAKKQATEVMAVSDDFAEHAGAGMENVNASDVLVPRLTIIQDLSPQLKPTKTEYIAGAQVGHICDVGTGDLFKEGILFIPVHYRKDFLEWAPRASGKGLVDIHAGPEILDKCSRDNEKKQPFLDNGNLISETAQYFGLNMSADGRNSFIPFTSSQLKKARKWMTLATGEKLERSDGSKFTPPLFYRSYNLTTAGESNNEGEWFGWKIERGLTLPELGASMEVDFREIMKDCKDFYDSLVTGTVRADVASMDEGSVNIDADPEGKPM